MLRLLRRRCRPLSHVACPYSAEVDGRSQLDCNVTVGCRDVGNIALEQTGPMSEVADDRDEVLRGACDNLVALAVRHT
jgi:hypothetical protein